MKQLTTIIFLSLGALSHAQDMDTIYMKDGSKYAVKITKQDRNTIQFERSGQKGKVNMDQVDRVFSCNIGSDRVDDFTGDRYVSTNPVNIGKTKMGLYIRSFAGRNKDTYHFSISAYVDLGCVSSDSKVLFKFEDEEVLTFFNFAETDCGGSSFFTCLMVDGDLEQYKDDQMIKDVEEKNLEKFLTVPVTKIRLSGTDSNLDFDVSDKYFMMNALSCLQKVF